MKGEEADLTSIKEATVSYRQESYPFDFSRYNWEDVSRFTKHNDQSEGNLLPCD